MKIRRHSNKSGQPPMTLTGTIKSGSIPPTFEQIQSGTGTGAGATPGTVLVNFIWATLINK